MSAVQWLSWGTDAFARARAENKPVLLSIAAPWCHSCHEMDRTTYADPDVAALVNERFVPIRVDADRRPDISERYALGGWPTTAFLNADGDLVGGGTFVSLARMPSVLDQVATAFASRPEELTAPPGRPVTPDMQTGSPRVSSHDDDLVALVFDGFDRDHGGFGIAPKFPLIGPLDLALHLYRGSPNPSLAEVVQTTLDAMGWGELYDDVDGGFFRYSTTRDWRQPHQEKLLDVNASLIRVYLDAADALEITRYRERAIEVLRYVQTWLADPVDGGWAGSQRADSTYYAATTPESRRGAEAPAVDRVLYASWNAAMVSSALGAARALDDSSLGDFAVRSLERVLLGCYSPGAGVAHYLDDRPGARGLLDDQFSMAAASLDAHAATGNIVYEMMAEELAHYAVRTMWDDEKGGFFDRAEPDEHERVGLMRQRLKPFVTNCDAARVLRRLAASSGDHEFTARADAALEAMAPLASSQGPLAAHYVLARRGT
jgi:uncharacterized protein